MASPVISVIIPVFNQLQFTKQALKSIYDNAFFRKSFEIVIIDNDSTDGTQEFFNLKGTDSKIRYVRNDRNEYVTPAWNQGIAISEGEFSLVINNDITLFKDFDRKLTYSYAGKVTCPTTLQHGTDKPYYQRSNINGTCWMIRKDDYVEPMPNELKLWYSDDFMFHRYGVTWLMGESVTHWGSQTLGTLPEANPTMAHDAKIYEWLLKERGWKDSRFPNA